MEKTLNQEKRLESELAFRMMKTIIGNMAREHNGGHVHGGICPGSIFLRESVWSCFELSHKMQMKMWEEWKESGDCLELVSAQRRTESLGLYLHAGNQAKPYLPLEQHMKEGQAQPGSDVYSLCAVLYRMITGQEPVDARERMAGAVLKKPSEAGIVLEDRRQEVLMKGLSLLIGDRYQNAGELYEALYGREESFEVSHVRTEEAFEEFYDNAEINFGESGAGETENTPHITEKVHTVSKGKKSLKKSRWQMFLEVSLGIFIGLLTIFILCIVDEMKIKYIPYSAAVVAVCYTCWIHKVWKVLEMHLRKLLAAGISGIVWGAVGFLGFFAAGEWVYSYYYNDEYRQAYSDYCYADIQTDGSGINWETAARRQEEIEKNNGVFYFGGRQYGLAYDKEQILLFFIVLCVSFAVHWLQKGILTFTEESKLLAVKIKRG